ncbi:MAG TPA: hypothetical protein VMM13_14905 [Euzebya sp.]|nr:hypothetical protein [Euzebya sp.]
MNDVEAWVLRRRADGQPRRAQLQRTRIDIGTPAADEVLAQPLFGSWEANMTHALDRAPIDICSQRGEAEIVIGNAGVLRVLAVGAEVNEVEPGQVAIMHSAGLVDERGQMTHALGYDAPGQMGVMATRMRVKGRQLIALPEHSRYSLQQWATFGIRYVTAWANWQVAGGLARIMHGQEAALDVWGWGGGTTLAELDLARRQGHRAVMISGQEHHLKAIAEAGPETVDRRDFADMWADPDGDAAHERAYRRHERAFLSEVRRRTDGRGVHVFVDYIGGPVWRATLRALARQAVVTTAGWKEGMRLDYLRAVECIAQHQFVHTHFASRVQAVAAIAYAESSGWMPDQPDRVYAFEEIPELAEDYRAGRTGYFPCYAIMPDDPAPDRPDPGGSVIRR